MKFLVLISLIISSSNALARFFKKEDLTVSVAGIYQSLYQKRGMTTYNGYQLLPSLSIQLGNPELFWAGKALYYVRPVFGENQLVRLRVHFDSTFDRPFYYTSEKEDERVRREKTHEFDAYYEYRWQGGSHVRAQLSKDFKAHKGLYTELYAHLALFNALESAKGKVMMQPGVFVAVGGGDKGHNEYLYGSGASEYRPTNVQYGLSVTSPDFIDMFWPTIRVRRFEILGKDNQTASFVRERSGWQVELLAGFRVW